MTGCGGDCRQGRRACDCRPAPDALACAIACHVREATPGLVVDTLAPGWGVVIAWRLDRLRRLVQLQLAWATR